MPPEAPALHTFEIAVVVPVKDEADTIEALLDSLLSQTRPPDEIIVVDGGSTDETVALIEGHRAAGHPVQLITALKAYPGEGRNLGVQKTTAPFIAFTDAGIRLAPDWLERLAAPMVADPSVDVVYGHYIPVEEGLFHHCASIVFVPPPSDPGFGRQRHHFIASSFMKRDVWEKVGGFPPFRVAEDRAFMEQIDSGGFHVAYAPDAVVHWKIPGDFRGTWRKFITHAYHGLVAGRARDWHIAVFRMYAVGLGCVVLGIVLSPIWFGALAALFAIRVGRQIWRKGSSKDRFNPAVWGLTAAIMVWIDMTVFTGFARWLLEGRP